MSLWRLLTVEFNLSTWTAWSSSSSCFSRHIVQAILRSARRAALLAQLLSTLVPLVLNLGVQRGQFPDPLAGFAACLGQVHHRQLLELHLVSHVHVILDEPDGLPLLRLSLCVHNGHDLGELLLLRLPVFDISLDLFHLLGDILQLVAHPLLDPLPLHQADDAHVDLLLHTIDLLPLGCLFLLEGAQNVLMLLHLRAEGGHDVSGLVSCLPLLDVGPLRDLEVLLLESCRGCLVTNALVRLPQGNLNLEAAGCQGVLLRSFILETLGHRR
mmetsp:Transcript_31115/g.93312  ORF Transcript_31115/g.93312 Transcript_31115/m.93312 type:complete len:270 (-) Transcript_31115:901-1710(-)